MIELGKYKKKLNIIEDQLGCPTYAQDFAKAILKIISNIETKKMKSGIFHFCGKNQCSWYEFASIIFTEAKKMNFKV